MAPARKPLRMGERRRGDPLPTLGDLRKGLPKSDKGVGREIKDFRVCNFNEEDADLLKFIGSIAEYVKGDQPYFKANHLQFVFPNPTVEENLVVYNECYKGGVLVHRCTPDEDAIILRALDPKTLKPVVLNGRHVETGEIVRCNGGAIYTYQGKSGPVEVGCSPVVRMKIMLRGQGRIGTWDVLSTSAIDGEHLQLQLETFYNSFASNPILAKSGLMGIPFVLHRMPPVDVPYYDASDARKSSKHSFISVEIDPSFGSLFLESTVRFALQAVDAKALPAPYQNRIDGPVDDSDDDDPFLDEAGGGAETVVIDPPVSSLYAETEWPMSGQEFYDWSQKQGVWKSRVGKKYSVPDVNRVLGCPVAAWVNANQGGYQMAAKTVRGTLGE